MININYLIYKIHGKLEPNKYLIEGKRFSIHWLNPTNSKLLDYEGVKWVLCSKYDKIELQIMSLKVTFKNNNNILYLDLKMCS